MLALLRAVPISRSAGNGLQHLRAVAQQVPLVRGDRVEPDGVDVIERHAETDRPFDVRRPRFELVRQLVPGRSLEGDRGDHVAAAEKGRHRLEQRLTAVEDADAGRAVQLVAGGGVEVDAERLHVHRHVVRGLRSVHQHRNVAGVGELDDPGDRVHRPERVGHVGDRDQPRALGQQRLELVEDQLTAVIDRRDPEPGAALLADQLPRHDVGVVLHRRDQHLVARLQLRPGERLGHEVDPLGRVAGEDDLAIARTR